MRMGKKFFGRGINNIMIDHSFKNWLLVKEAMAGIAGGVKDDPAVVAQVEKAVKAGKDPIDAAQDAVVDQLKSGKITVDELAAKPKTGQSESGVAGMKKQMKKKMKAR
jgi:hypothetical protein